MEPIGEFQCDRNRPSKVTTIMDLGGNDMFAVGMESGDVWVYKWQGSLGREEGAMSFQQVGGVQQQGQPPMGGPQPGGTMMQPQPGMGQPGSMMQPQPGMGQPGGMMQPQPGMGQPGGMMQPQVNPFTGAPAPAMGVAMGSPGDQVMN